MTAIERTAYPRFRRSPSAAQLASLFTPRTEELHFARTAARGDSQVLSLLVMLKCFQSLGYFCAPEDVPPVVIRHIALSARIGADASALPPRRSRQRYQGAIRKYLTVSPFDSKARRLAIRTVYEAAQTMDNPADLINACIERLVKERCELPAFSTLNRLAGRVRTLVNNQFHFRILSRLTAEQRAELDGLLLVDAALRRSPFDLLKEPPKSARISHLRGLLDRLVWMLSFGSMAGYLAEIPHTKVRHFAALARSLDAAEMRDLSPDKRHALAVCLLHTAQAATRDHLVEMFLKRMATLHNHAKQTLAESRERHRAATEALLGVLGEVATVGTAQSDDGVLGGEVRRVLDAHGRAAALLAECESIAAFHGNNHLPLLWPAFGTYRSAFFWLVRLLDIRPTTPDKTLLDALAFVLRHEHRRTELLETDLDLGFAGEQWQRTVYVRVGDKRLISRRHLETCVFSHLAMELKTGDLCVAGSEQFADYRAQLLDWQQCEPLVGEYCRHLGFAPAAGPFIEQLKLWLIRVAEVVDHNFPNNAQVVIDERGEPSLKRDKRSETDRGRALSSLIAGRLGETSVLDALGHTVHWAPWTRHFGPLSGSDPKLENPLERYLYTVFGYGCNIGPAETARHTRGRMSHHAISFVNHRHVDVARLDAALRDIVNLYNRLGLPLLWGSGKAAAADGTKFDLYEENLLSEYHIRYGGYGGIAYHHISDKYIALFSHFIACGVWEAVYILDGLIENQSDIQPESVAADTQGQSTPVFGLAYLLGIDLQPRIRNWQDLKFFRPDRGTTYKHIDTLFSDAIDWRLIETHWQDLLRVVLSIRAGKVLPSTLLRKLGNYSRKNKLFQAFQELGRVVRTVFLLRYLGDEKLRERVQALTNKMEAYNGFSKWLAFGNDRVIPEKDPLEQEKRIKYMDLVANAVILHNTVHMSDIIRALMKEGVEIPHEELAMLSPYMTGHLKRFGDYVLDLESVPLPIEDALQSLS